MAEKKPNERVATAVTGSLAPSEGLLTEMGKVARYNAYSQPSSYIDTSTGAGAEAWIWKNYTGKERDDMYAGLYSQYDTYGSPYYNPYRKATNGQIVNNLKSLGLQMPDNITGDWLQKAGAVYEPYLKKSAYSGSPSSPGSKATAEEQIAYGLYQLRTDEMTTQKAEQEWADLKKEITYWTKKGLSDREIKAKINMDKYSTLKKMDDSLYTGSVVGLNRNVGYSKDAIDGVIWKARNEGYDDTDDFTAAVYSRMHSGKGDTTTAYQLAKRVPGTSTYMPYDSGCTDDDARMLFGKDSFTWQDIQQYQMDAYLSGDTDMAKMAKRLADAEDTTQAAEQALASLQNWMYKVDIANANIGDKDPYTAIQSIVESQLEEDDYKVLTQMDNARYLGNPLALNRSVKYRKEDVVDELYARYCRENGISLTTSEAYKRTHSIPETAAPAETTAPSTTGTTPSVTQPQSKLVTEANGLLGKGSKVDIGNRKPIPASKLTEAGWEDAGEGYATLYSMTYGIGSENNQMNVLITPIRADGTVLTPEGVDAYLAQFENCKTPEEVMKLDKQGLVLDVDQANWDDEASLKKLNDKGEMLHTLSDQVEQEKIQQSNAFQAPDETLEHDEAGDISTTWQSTHPQTTTYDPTHCIPLSQTGSGLSGSLNGALLLADAGTSDTGKPTSGQGQRYLNPQTNHVYTEQQIRDAMRKAYMGVTLTDAEAEAANMIWDSIPWFTGKWVGGITASADSQATIIALNSDEEPQNFGEWLNANLFGAPHTTKDLERFNSTYGTGLGLTNGGFVSHVSEISNEALDAIYAVETEYASLQDKVDMAMAFFEDAQNASAEGVALNVYYKNHPEALDDVNEIVARIDDKEAKQKAEDAANLEAEREEKLKTSQTIFAKLANGKTLTPEEQTFYIKNMALQEGETEAYLTAGENRDYYDSHIYYQLSDKWDAYTDPTLNKRPADDPNSQDFYIEKATAVEEIVKDYYAQDAKIAASLGMTLEQLYDKYPSLYSPDIDERWNSALAEYDKRISGEELTEEEKKGVGFFAARWAGVRMGHWDAQEGFVGAIQDVNELFDASTYAKIRDDYYRRYGSNALKARRGYRTDLETYAFSIKDTQPEKAQSILDTLANVDAEGMDVFWAGISVSQEQLDDAKNRLRGHAEDIQAWLNENATQSELDAARRWSSAVSSSERFAVSQVLRGLGVPSFLAMSVGFGMGIYHSSYEAELERNGGDEEQAALYAVCMALTDSATEAALATKIYTLGTSEGAATFFGKLASEQLRKAGAKTWMAGLLNRGAALAFGSASASVGEIIQELGQNTIEHALDSFWSGIVRGEGMESATAELKKIFNSQEIVDTIISTFISTQFNFIGFTGAGTITGRGTAFNSPETLQTNFMAQDMLGRVGEAVDQTLNGTTELSDQDLAGFNALATQRMLQNMGLENLTEKQKATAISIVMGEINQRQKNGALTINNTVEEERSISDMSEEELNDMVQNDLDVEDDVNEINGEVTNDDIIAQEQEEDAKNPLAVRDSIGRPWTIVGFNDNNGRVEVTFDTGSGINSVIPIENLGDFGLPQDQIQKVNDALGYYQENGELPAVQEQATEQTSEQTGEQTQEQAGPLTVTDSIGRQMTVTGFRNENGQTLVEFDDGSGTKTVMPIENLGDLGLPQDQIQRVNQALGYYNELGELPSDQALEQTATPGLPQEVMDILERTGRAMAPFKEMMEKAAGWLQSIAAAQDAVSQAESVLLEGKGYPINYKSTVKQALKALSDLTGIKINQGKYAKLIRQLQTNPIGLLNDLFGQLVEAQDNAQAQLEEAQQKYRQIANDGYIKAGLTYMYTDQATQEEMVQDVADNRTAETITAGGLTADEDTQKKLDAKKEAERDAAKAEEENNKAKQKVETAKQNLQNATQNRETDKNGKRELAAAKAVVTAKEEEDKSQKTLQETHDKLKQANEDLNKNLQNSQNAVREQSKASAGAVVAAEGERVVGDIAYNDSVPVSTESSVPAIAPKSLLPDTTDNDIEQQNNRSEEEKAADEEITSQVNQAVTESEAEQQAARQSIDTQAMEDRIYGLRYRDKNNKSRPVTEKRKAASKVNGIVNAFASVEGGLDYFNAMSDEELTALLRDGAFKSVKASTVEHTVRDYMRDHPLQGQAAEEQAPVQEEEQTPAEEQTPVQEEQQAPQTEQKAPVKAPPAKNDAVKGAPDANPLLVKTGSGDTVQIVGFGKASDGQDTVKLRYVGGEKTGTTTVPVKRASGKDSLLDLQDMNKVYAAQSYWKEHGELPPVQQQEEQAPVQEEEQTPAEEQTPVQEEEQTPSEEQEEQQEEEEQAPEEETEKPLTPEEEQAVLDLVARRKQGNDSRGYYLKAAEDLLGYTPSDYQKNAERRAEIDALIERLQAEVDKRQEKVMTREERDKALEAEMNKQEAETDKQAPKTEQAPVKAPPAKNTAVKEGPVQEKPMTEQQAPVTEQAPSERQETTAEADEKQTKRDAAKKINSLIDKAYETGEYKYIQQAFDLDTTWSEEHDGEQLFLEDRGALDLDEEAFQKEIETSRARVEAAQEETITLKNTYAQLTAMATGEYEDYNAFTKALRIEAQKLARRTKAFKNGTKTSEQIANSILKHVWDEYQKSRQAQAPQTEQQQAPATEQQQAPQTEQKAPKVKAPATEQKVPKQQEKTQTPPRQKSGAEVYRDMLSRFTKAKKAYDNLLDSGKYKAENYGSMLSTLKGLLNEYGEMLRSGNAGERWFAMRAFAESNTGLLDMLEGLNSEARYQMGMPVGDSLDIDRAIGIAKKAIPLHNAAREAIENGDKAKAKTNADAFIAYANQFADMAEKIVQDRLGKAEEAGELLKNPENTKAPKKTKKPNTLAKRGKTTNRQNQNGEQEAPKHSPIQTFLRLAEDLNVGEYTRQNRTRLRMKPGVNGIYKGFEDAIGIRGTENNQLETTMHEIGHALENRISFHGTEEMWNALPASFRDAYKNDLAKLDPDAAHEVRTSEAVAEFVAAYMQSRALAVSIFGESVVSDFETRLETADRKYSKAFERALEETRAYAAASTQQQMRVRMSNVMHNRNPQGYLKTMRDGIRGLISSEVNSTYAAKRFDNAAKDTDLRGFMRMLAFSERAGMNIVLNELRGLNGEYIREGFAQASTIDQETNKVLIHNKEEADLLSLYSIALQAIDRYNIAAAEAEETAQDRAIETIIKTGQEAGLTMDQIQAAIDRVLDQISKGVPFASQEEIDAATKRTTVYGDNIGIDKLKAFVQDCQQNHGDIVKAHDQMMSWWQDFMNTYMPAAGVSQDTINYLQAKYPNYVPTLRDIKQGDWSSASSSKAVQGFTMEKIKGSDLDVINPLETMQETIIRVVAAARQNQMAGEMYEALDEMSAHPEDREALGNFALIVNGEGDHTITYKDQNGKNHYIEIRDQVLYDAITKGQGNAGDLIRTVGKLTRTMAMLTTGNNPLFSAKNFIRDFQHSVNWGTWANNYAFGLWRWFKAAYDVAADSGLLNIAKPVVNFFGGKIQASDTFQQYKALGGGGFTQLGVPSTNRNANAMMRNVIDNYGQNKVTHALSEGASHLLHFATFEKLNSVIETTSRYVEFKYGKHDLTTAEGVREAFLAAQDVTVDFAQNGWSNGAAAMRALVPFYNATIQGSLQTAELLGDLANEKTRGRAMKILAKTAINNVLLGALAYGLLAHFGDDDDKEWYELLADGLKWDNIIVPNFTRDKDKRRYVRLPLSQDPISKTFANLGRVIMQAGDGDQLSLDVGGFVRHVISGTYPNVFTGSIFAPVVALFSNKNYLGNSIVPDYLVDQYKADKTLQTSATTPEIFNWISRAIYGVFGDTLPPPMIQYLAEQYSGYAGQVVVPMLSPDSMNGGHLDPLGALWRVFRNSWTIDPAYTNDVNDAYFDGLDMLETITNSKEKSAIISTSLTDEQAQECQDVAANLISTNGAITQLQNQMTKIREEEAEIRKRTDLNRDTKEAMVKSLVEKEVELKMQAVAMINDFREEYINGTDPIKLMVYGARNVMGPGPLSNLPQQVITDLHDNADYAVTLSDFYSSHKDISKPSMTSTLHGEDGTTYKIPYLFTPDGKPASVEYGNAFSLGMKDAWELKYSVQWDSADDKKKKKIASEMISAGNANAKLWFEKQFGVDLK